MLISILRIWLFKKLSKIKTVEIISIQKLKIVGWDNLLILQQI